MELVRQYPLDPKVFLFTSAAVFLYAFLSYFFREDIPFPGFKQIGKEPGDWFNAKAKKRWDQDAIGILRQGFQETNGQAFQVMGSFGPMVVLPASLCEEIRSDARLSFRGFIERQALTKYPGLDVIHAGTQGDIIQDTVRKHLTQALGGLTETLSDETTLVLNENLPPSKDWQNSKFIMAATQIAARLSARVFLGEHLCHNKEWIEISINFSIVTMRAQEALRSWPAFLRPFVHRFIPELHRLRHLIKKARKIIDHELAARRAARVSVKKPQDSLTWLDDVRGDRPFDVVAGQLFLTVAAIHTTSIVLTALMYDLISNQQYIGLLREEIIQVLREDGGWKKTSLYKMKLMDSCMKESQRLNILGPVMMNRRVEADMTLSDGTYLPAGVHICVPTYHMRDPEIFGTNADKFDGHRFLRMRGQPGQENKWQFVSTSPEFLSFGHGKHACPGRFFASNEIKIALAHLIMKYDWKEVGEKPKSRFESRFVPDPATLVSYKSRKPEIEL